MGGRVGRAPVPEVQARDARVLAAVQELGTETGVHVTALRSTCDLEARTLMYSLHRLRNAGKVERRDGYRWWPVLDTD